MMIRPKTSIKDPKKTAHKNGTAIYGKILENLMDLPIFILAFRIIRKMVPRWLFQKEALVSLISSILPFKSSRQLKSILSFVRNITWKAYAT